MRVCPSCYGLFGPDTLSCPKDGTRTEDSVDILIGHVLGGSYMVRSVIGEGGMGVVYSGEHTTIGRRVALKVIRPELSLRDDIMERFIQEARAVNTIGHANIVNVYDFGKTPFGTCYIVMEYIDGKTIRQLLDDEGPQPLNRVRNVVMGVGQALAAAHGKGFIHRDVKPENIIYVERNGSSQVKLVDFGIAKLLHQDKGPKTRTGSTMGTPQYMCPEQLEDSAFDHRADVYSFGAVTFEMITGVVPYPGKSHAEVRQLQLTRMPTPPSATRPEVPISRKIDAAVLWALSLDPNTRCPRIEDFLAAYQEGYEDIIEPSINRLPQKDKKGSLALVLAIILGLVSVGLGGTLVYVLKNKPEPVITPQPKLDTGKPAAPATPTKAEAVKLAKKAVEQAFASPPGDPEYKLVIQYLTRVKRPSMAAALRGALKNPETQPEELKSAALALGEMKDQGSKDVLAEALKENISFTAWSIAYALAQLEDPRGSGRLRRDLAQLRGHKNVLQRNTILHFLHKLGDPSATAAWKAQLRLQAKRDKPFRAWGYLAAMGDKAAADQLRTIMAEPDWSASVTAAEALLPTDAPAARQTLQAALPHTSGRIRLNAAMLLAYSGEEKSAKVLKVLIEVLQSPDAEFRQDAALALGSLPNPATHRRLRQALHDPAKNVALAAAVALLN
jgi:serine/threonine protein kinase/HEAT repeat protein